jgi:enoyl-CoA hydratase/carnithine racemase
MMANRRGNPGFDEKVHVIVIRPGEKFFCAGADISML